MNENLLYILLDTGMKSLQVKLYKKKYDRVSLCQDLRLRSSCWERNDTITAIHFIIIVAAGKKTYTNI